MFHCEGLVWVVCSTSHSITITIRYTNQSRRSNHDIEQSHIGLQLNRWRVYIGTSGGFAIGMTGGIHRNTQKTPPVRNW
jgi:hypothetical protein